MELRKILTVVLMAALVVCGFCQKAEARASVEIHKTEDAHLTVWNTLFSFRIGDPIFDGDVPGCHTTKVYSSWWATDLSVEQQFVSSGVVATHDMAPILPDPMNPGQYMMERMLPWLEANYGSATQMFPDLRNFSDTYVAVDIDDWLSSGASMPAPGQIIPLSPAGTSPDLPGYLIGTTPISFDPFSGWVNNDPHIGDVTVVGEIELTATHAGDNCWNVYCGGQSMVEFGGPDIPAIPADFFGPGSDPFTEVVELNGANPSGPDVVVRRLDPFDLPQPPPSTDTIPIELIELSLKSCAPITVTYDGGQNPESWDIQVDLSPVPAAPGQMEITRTHENGGTFTCDFPVQPIFTFTKVGSGSPVGTLSLPNPIQTSSAGASGWQDTSQKATAPCDGQGFYPVGPQPMVMQSPQLTLELHPPDPCRRHIALSTAEQWERAINMGRVVPMEPDHWARYIPKLNGGYPGHTYLRPTLQVFAGDRCYPPEPCMPTSPGMVMLCGDEDTPSGPYSSAWLYVYPEDPDLTNVYITISVLAPNDVNVVSFGMEDATGLIRGWYWNVANAPGPGTLQANVLTTITIDTALTGATAATPTSASYTSDLGFDITQVVILIFDENWAWVAGAGVPPPGMLVPRAWNYWYDLIITPKADPSGKPDNPVKWSQPPVEIGPAIFLGWDEESVRHQPPLMADDWLCKDPRPVTDIHWWGSYLGWMDEDPPPGRPTAFHFGIWTDVPKDSANPFSHPGRMVWEHICTDFQWNFAGYDKDPRASSSTTGDTTNFDPTLNDSCFQFNCDLPAAEWFYQKPNINGHGTVYWLSIAAIYPTGITDLEYPWGWKTRPHFFNDDAVRIRSLESGLWPPAIDEKYFDGEPVEFPEKISWDLAFELTTNKVDPPPFVEWDFNGIADLWDFGFWADWYLEDLTLD